MDRLKGQTTVELESLMGMVDYIHKLEEHNKALSDQIDELKEKEGQRVIVCYIDDDGEESVDLEDFEDVKKDVEKLCKVTIEKLQKENKELKEEVSSIDKHVAILQKRIDELKSRNLWKRILNK